MARWSKVLRSRWFAYPVVFGSAYLGLCLLLANTYLHPMRIVPTTPRELRDVAVPTPAGPDPAWATPALAAGNPHAKVVFVMSHGYGGTRETWSDLMLCLNRDGYEAIAPAMPGQDASPEPTVGFGKREAAVIVDTVKYVRDRYPAGHPPKIVLLGVSMGGAASWLAAGMIPDQVDAVVTEGAYARFDVTMRRWFDRVLPGGSIVFRPVFTFASAMGRIDPSSIVPLDAAARWRKPALIIQAENDEVIERPNAIQLSAAAHAPLWIVPKASHASCRTVDSRGYLEHLESVAAQVTDSKSGSTKK
jgi:pimeloyl-ACP methyl ester carboxylesterase